MATAYKPRVPNDVADPGLDAEVDAFVNKVHATIQDARSKMTEEEAAKADEQAKAIFDRATSVAKSSRHSA
ncbi:MAG: hypothetical protein WB755_18535 [Terriglobales bacterium]